MAERRTETVHGAMLRRSALAKNTPATQGQHCRRPSRGHARLQEVHDHMLQIREEVWLLNRLSRALAG